MLSLLKKIDGVILSSISMMIFGFLYYYYTSEKETFINPHIFIIFGYILLILRLAFLKERQGER